MSERQLGQAFPGNETFNYGEIPDDVLNAAHAAWETMPELSFDNGITAMSKAILAERERCAKVAESFPTILTETMELPPSQYDIALAIRKGGG